MKNYKSKQKYFMKIKQYTHSKYVVSISKPNSNLNNIAI